jgi:PAS domain S-box-containing protein
MASNETLSDLVDIVQIQKLAASHYKAAGMPIGIIDAQSGAILVGAGWQDICVRFHRAHAESARLCEESDRHIKSSIVDGRPCAYKCRNGLWDIGIPILVEYRHLATLFLGQFLYEGESLDRDFFISQAERYGYDLPAYLDALDRMPVFSREKVNNILDYNVAFANFIADLAGKKKSLNRELELRRQTEAALLENGQKFRAIFDQTFQFMGLITVDGRLIEANRTALQFAGVREADVIGKPIWETPWWTHSIQLQKKLHEAVKNAAAGEFVRFEVTHPSATGSIHHMDFSLKPVTDEAGGLAFLIAEARDITERKRADLAVLKANRVINALWECNNALIRVRDESQLLQEICRVIVEVGSYRMAWVGYAENDANRSITPIARFGHEDGYLEKLKATWKIIEPGRDPVGACIRMDAPIVVRDVERQVKFAPWRDEALKRGYVSLICLPIPVEDRLPGCLAIYASEPDAFDEDEVRLLSKLALNLSFGIRTLRNSLARKQAEIELQRAHDELDLRVRSRTAQLEKANEQLRRIPSRLIAVQEEERRRLASELHDSISQTLAAVKFRLEIALRLRDEGNDSAALKNLEEFVPILQRSIEETRAIYMGLRPSVLDNLGILAALEWLRHECMKLYPQRHIELETQIAEEEIPEDLKVNIFRIVQEALNNIAKHSMAEWVDISLSKNGGGIELTVSDDGVGMNLSSMQTGAPASLGFTSMRERAELTGGTFSVESTSGEGTAIRVHWPADTSEQSAHPPKS